MMDKPADKRTDQRVNPPPQTDIRIAVQGVSCELCNISEYGLGVRVETPTAYHLGQRIDDIRMSISGSHYRLRGSIAHITRTISGSVLGIRLEINSIEEYRFIADVKKRWSH